MEFLVEFEIEIPRDVPAKEADHLRNTERAHGRELWKAGMMKRIWRVPGTRDAVVLYEAQDATELHSMLEALPLFPFMKINVIPLSKHPFETEETDIVDL